MKKEKLQPLPLGTSDFGSLRKDGQIYVDKTDLVYELASKRGKFFLSRPRRFGKSLMISVLECLFKNEIDLFRGLAIENLWNDKSPYHVVKLDFSRINTTESKFSYLLENYLEAQFSEIGFLKKNNGILFANQLELFIKKLPLSSLVLLIDEYDAPLTACLNDPKKFNEVREALSNFYSILKSNDRSMRFLFLTGITKFSKSSIFSSLNTLKDISLHFKYGALLGYTREEVEEYFEGYLEEACRVLDCSQEKLLSELARHYDGFCFDRRARTRVFAPWSLLNFFSDPEEGLLNYWFTSGGMPSVLVHYLKSHSLKRPESYGAQQTIALSTLENSSDLETLSDVGLLTQTGYLTIKKVVGSTAYVDYPNAEVRTSMAQLYIEQISGGKTAEEAGVDNVARRLAVASAESIVGLLGRMFEAIDYQNYPVRDEASVRALAQVYLAGAGLDPRAEVHGSLGRSDLEVEAGHRLWVFEFKVKRAGDNEEALLREALEQMRLRRYGEAREAEERLRVALVFSLEERRFVRWAVCPEP